jgi:hypothetical protein
MRILAALLFTVWLAFGSEIDGKWDFTWDTPGGVRKSQMQIADKDGTVTLTTEGREIKGAGTFKDGVVKFAGRLYSPEGGHEGEFRLEGKVDGGTLKGTASWEEHGMTFSATRAQ